MVWTPKATSPVTFNLGAAVAALITGDSTWAWLLDWIPLLSPVQVRTADLCAAGPRVVAPFVAADFVSDPHLAFDRALSQLGPNIGRIQDAAFDRVFGAYCEQVTSPTGGLTCTSFAEVANYTVTGNREFFATFQPIPAGTTKIRCHNIASNSNPTGLRLVGYFNGSNVANPTDPNGGVNGFNNVPVGFTGDIPIPGSINQLTAYADEHSTWNFSWCHDSPTVESHAPTAQPQPAGVVAPVTRVYADIPSLGAELDRQELKLDVILGAVRLLAQRGVVGPTTADDPVPVTNAPVIAPGAIGYRIDIAGIPPGTGEMFGTPIKYHRIGRYTLGSANGFLPAVELEHATTLVASLPAGVDRIQVVVNAPETATVTALYPPKLV